MTLEEYQDKAMTTCMESCENFGYMMLNLVGEVGELASKVAKAIRKEKFAIKENNLYGQWDTFQEGSDYDKELRAEAGDVLWQLAGLCQAMGWSLEEIAQENLDKLASRHKRGVIDGNGDNR
jgi:NTP pyrophosphatase (non-canonical NTP hydrolase)